MCAFASWRGRAPSLALAAALVIASPAAHAATVAVATTGGVMQQPTSHYYHACYGMSVEGANDAQSFRARAVYTERPEFKYAGFADKDYGYFALVGTKVTKTTGYGLYAYVGYGRMEGYVKVDRTEVATSGPTERRYAVPGPTTLVELSKRVGPVDFAVNHQLFTGFVDRDQVDAYVAWPYTFFQASVGYVW